MNVQVLDPFDAASDPEMPSLAMAIDPARVQEQFMSGLACLAGEDKVINFKAIRVIRYKPKKRCVIEYDIEVERPDLPAETVTIIGKVRAKRNGKSAYRLLKAFRDAGFGSDSDDGISVPEPVGIVPEFRMWLQRKVPGQVMTDLLTSSFDVELARRIAMSAYKIHNADVPTERCHTMADELSILRKCLTIVANKETIWSGRIGRLMDSCERLAASVPRPRPCGIHRDFYSDQVIVDSTRLCIIDFDLYCHGDPGLDIGNFLGHITEYSLRHLGDPDGLAGMENAILENFIEMSGERTRASVLAYAALTLVRHIYLSTLFPERRSFTGRLLELCEERLGVAKGIYA